MIGRERARAHRVSTRSPCLLLFWPKKRTRWKDPKRLKNEQGGRPKNLRKELSYSHSTGTEATIAKQKHCSPFLSLVEQKVSLKFGRANRQKVQQESTIARCKLCNTCVSIDPRQFTGCKLSSCLSKFNQTGSEIRERTSYLKLSVSWFNPNVATSNIRLRPNLRPLIERACSKYPF